MLEKFLLLVGAVGLLAAIGVSHFIQKRQQDEYHGTINTLLLLDQYKFEYALKWTNGYPMTPKDLAPFFDGPDVAAYFCDNETSPKVTSARHVDVVYIISPVGVPPKVRFIHALFGHPAGSEISAPYAHIIDTLYRVDDAKKKAASVHHWSDGSPLPIEEETDLARRLGLTYTFKGVAGYMGGSPRTFMHQSGRLTEAIRWIIYRGNILFKATLFISSIPSANPPKPGS